MDYRRRHSKLLRYNTAPEVNNPTATLLEHALLAQGFMGISKVAFPRRLQLPNRDSTGAKLSNAIKCRCRVKITKRAGWQWHRTRLSDPDRAARLWLAVAVATLWLLSVGGAAEETIPASTLLDVTALCPGHPRSRRATRLRLVSVFRQGWVALLVALLRQEPLPEGRFVPEPLPAVPALEDEAS